MSHALDVGYELQASLLIDGSSGKPLAPLGLNLVCRRGVRVQWSRLSLHRGVFDELVERIHRQDQLGLDEPFVRVSKDREADSLPHLRQLMNTRWLTAPKKIRPAA